MQKLRAKAYAGAAAAIFAACLASPSQAERIVVPPGAADLQGVVDKAADGDVVALQGAHAEPVRIARKLTLEGEAGASITGPGKGSVLTVSAPEAIVRGLTIKGSGKDLETIRSKMAVRT